LKRPTIAASQRTVVLWSAFSISSSSSWIRHAPQSAKSNASGSRLLDSSWRLTLVIALDVCSGVNQTPGVSEVTPSA
jgi:hypothetical protein